MSVIPNSNLILDTNVVAQCLGNNSVLELIKSHYLIHYVRPVILDIVLMEMNRVFHSNSRKILEKLGERFGVQPITENVSKFDFALGDSLVYENRFRGLHCPDSIILAHAINTNQFLVSYDKSLNNAAKPICKNAINANIPEEYETRMPEFPTKILQSVTRNNRNTSFQERITRQFKKHIKDRNFCLSSKPKMASHSHYHT